MSATPAPTTVVQDDSTNSMHLGYVDEDGAHALCNRRFKVWERMVSAQIVNDWNDYGCPKCEAKAGSLATEQALLSKFAREV